MKKSMAMVFITLIFLGNLPSLANSISTTETTNIINRTNNLWCCYRVYGRATDEFNFFVNRGHVDILVIGDGSSDLDLYVYAGNRLLGKSDGNSDDEKVCLGEITRSGNIRIRVVNRGENFNDYQLIIK